MACSLEDEDEDEITNEQKTKQKNKQKTTPWQIYTLYFLLLFKETTKTVKTPAIKILYFVPDFFPFHVSTA